MRLTALACACALLATAGGCATPAAAPLAPLTSSASTRASPAHHLLEAAVDLDGAVVGALAPGDRATVAVVFASWCPHCQDEMPTLAALRDRDPHVRILGVNYRGHEEYEGRGDAVAVRTFIAERAPWLRVVPAGDRLWAALGRPPKIPTVYVFDRAGRLVRTFDRRRDPIPTLAELEAALPP